jgi:biotin transport system substrate-specific component
MITTTVLSYPNLVDYFIPTAKSKNISLLRELSLVFGFSLFIGLCSQVSFFLPHLTPVPLTLQTFGVILAGAVLGSRRGALAVLAYLIEGAIGLPVFSSGSTIGLIRLFGFTGGYLWSFPLVAYLTGWLCEKGLDKNYKTSVFAMLPGTMLVYAVGVPWLAFMLHVTLPVAISQGMILFIPGDILKVFLAAALLPSIWKILQLKKIRPYNKAYKNLDN